LAKRSYPNDSELLGEFANIALGALRTGSKEGFRQELHNLENFHRFLLEISMVDVEGANESYAALKGAWLPSHTDWVATYRELYATAVDQLLTNPGGLSELLGTPRRLLSAGVLAGPSVISQEIMDLWGLAAYFLMSWHTKKANSNQYSDETPHGRSSAELEAYEHATRQIVESLEQQWMFIAPREYGVDDPEYWHASSLKWPLIVAHARISAELLVRSAWNNDTIGFDEYLDHFMLWPGGRRHFEKEFDWTLRFNELNSELIDQPWDQVRSALAANEFGNTTLSSAKSVFDSILRRLKFEVRLLSSQLTLSWWLDNKSGSYTLDFSRKILLSRPSSEEGEPAAIENGHRLFERVFDSWLLSSNADAMEPDMGQKHVLDNFVERLDRLSEPRLRVGRVYSLSTKHSRYELSQAFQVLLVAHFTDQSAGRIIEKISEHVRQLLRKGGTGESIERLLRSFSRLKQKPPTEHDRFEMAVRAFKPDIDVSEVWHQFAGFLDRASDEIERIRTERLLGQEVSQEVLESISERLDRKLKEVPGAVPIFQNFTIDETRASSSTNSFKLSSVDKGFLVIPPLRAGSDAYIDGIVSQTAQAFARMVFASFWRKERQSIASESGPESKEFWQLIEQISSDIPNASIQLCHQDYSSFIYSDLVLREQVSGLARMYKSDLESDLYVGTVNNIDVYVFGREVGRATLFSTDELETITYSIQENGLFVEAKIKDSKPEESECTIEFLYNQGVSWRKRSSAVVTFPPSEAMRG